LYAGLLIPLRGQRISAGSLHLSPPSFVPDFVWTDQQWETPELEDLVVYELHVEEFNSTFDGVIERLTY
jgi:1,4-alpha-glucan branching enzyme